MILDMALWAMDAIESVGAQNASVAASFALDLYPIGADLSNGIHAHSLPNDFG